MLASGFAALGYQIVWTQQSALWLGHETAAVLAVVAAFFGGLAAGALLLGARIDRSSRPGRWYAMCEAVIGLWSLALALLMAPLAGALLALTGAEPSPAWQWTVAFVGTLLLLLPATAAMGATLPAMERLLARRHAGGMHIGALYAANTFGAVLGVVVAAFWLVPALGLVGTAFVCALINLACAVLAWRLFPVDTPAPTPAADAAAAGRGTLALLVATGLLGIGYEVLAVRVLSQVAENTVYTFALLLAVYLVGTAVGAAIYTRSLAATTDPARLRDRLLQALAAACLLGLLAMSAADDLKQAVLRLAGPSLTAALAAEAALAVAALLLPTLLMGALFSHLATRARAEGIGFGRAIGVNTLGAAAAPMVFGVMLVPAAGLLASTLAIVAGYLLLSLRRAAPAPAFWAVATATLGVAIAVPSLRFVDLPDGGRVVSHRDGAMAAVTIVEDARGVATLHINNRQQEGSSATRLADARQALLPLLLHPAPQRALFLGLGTGVTAASAAQEATLRVDAVELLPEVIAASAHFRQPIEAEAPGTPARLHLLAADARRFVRASAQRYDLIVSENFHPARSGSGSLYTVEHFTAVRERLAPAGVSASGCRCTSSTSTPCAASCALIAPRSRRAGPCWQPTASIPR
jgi:spermidine synthase